MKFFMPVVQRVHSYGYPTLHLRVQLWDGNPDKLSTYLELRQPDKVSDNTQGEFECFFNLTRYTDRESFKATFADLCHQLKEKNYPQDFTIFVDYHHQYHGEQVRSSMERSIVLNPEIAKNPEWFQERVLRIEDFVRFYEVSPLSLHQHVNDKNPWGLPPEGITAPDYHHIQTFADTLAQSYDAISWDKFFQKKLAVSEHGSQDLLWSDFHIQPSSWWQSAKFFAQDMTRRVRPKSIALYLESPQAEETLFTTIARKKRGEPALFNVEYWGTKTGPATWIFCPRREEMICVPGQAGYILEQVGDLISRRRQPRHRPDFAPRQELKR